MSDISIYEKKMAKTIDNYKSELDVIRAGRANPHILDKVRVEYYGAETPLNQVANITVPEAHVILIQPWDINSLKAIEKAIQTSDIGINPNNDGKVIRLVLPPLTEERRKELTKDIKKKCEEAKISIRNIRREAIDDFKKENQTEDERGSNENKIQKLTDKYIKKIDELTKNKTKDIMTV